jgi:adenine-specific DNA-methyltransferase
MIGGRSPIQYEIPVSTPYHSLYWATLLTLRAPVGSMDRLSQSLATARVDLNPHQVDAALFAIRSPLSKGVILADEVGLGKTIEASLVIAQRWAERKRRVLLIVPATLRKQWQQELTDKFGIPSEILESAAFRQRGLINAFDQPGKVMICSYQLASNRGFELRANPWDLVVIDEAHRLRNVYKKSSKIAANIQEATLQYQKILLTATPLQNSLMELYGLVSFIDPQVFGDERSFRDQFADAALNPTSQEKLRARLRPLCMRTLRKQVLEYVPFTARHCITRPFFPTPEEHDLYERVSTYLQREALVAIPDAQRHLITLVLRKLLASSTFAIATTLEGMANRLDEEIKAAEAPAQIDLPDDYEAPSEDDDSDEEDEQQPPVLRIDFDPGAARAESQNCGVSLIWPGWLPSMRKARSFCPRWKWRLPRRRNWGRRERPSSSRSRAGRRIICCVCFRNTAIRIRSY